MPRTAMACVTWLGTFGNGAWTGMIKIITIRQPQCNGTLWGQRQAIAASFAAARGTASVRSTSAPPTASGTTQATGSTTSGSGVFQDRISPLHFRTFALSPDPNLLEPQKQRVRDTITRLELNDDDAYVNERARAIYGYADGKLPFDNHARHYPFIAAEMTSQNFDLAHLPTFKGLLKNPRLRSALTRQGWLA